MIKIGFIGQPNVGKSAAFNYLAGFKAMVSNYPGTTVEVTEARVRFGGQTIELVDTPGIYSLSDASEEERVTKSFLLSDQADAIVDIVDCTALERSLYLTLQVLELGVPLVVGLNFYEEARRRGIVVDPDRLEEELGVPVEAINALTGKGIPRLLWRALEERAPRPFAIKYDDHIEWAIGEVERLLAGPPTPPRFAAIRALEGDEDFIKYAKHRVEEIKAQVSLHSDIAMDIAVSRHGVASLLARRSSHIRKKPVRLGVGEWFDNFILHPLWGTIFTALVFLAIFASLFWLGGAIQGFLSALFEERVLPHLLAGLERLGPAVKEVVANGLLGAEAGIAIAIPYVGIFYLVLAFLEDVGILPRMVLLLDRYMRRMGLPGRAVIPLMLGLGCTVPAIRSTRVLESRVERLKVAFLLSLVPCSSRTAIILGVTANYIGWQAALIIYLLSLLLLAGAGLVLDRLAPGEAILLMIELPEYRVPLLRNVLAKSWMRMKDFVYVVVPLLVAGGMAYGALESLELVGLFAEPFRPLTEGWLMLPKETIAAFVYGFLQKDLTIAMLVSIAGGSNLIAFMSPLQLFTFSLAAVVQVPCVIAFSMLVRELGWKDALLMTLAALVLGFGLAGLLARLAMLAGFP